MVVYAILSNRAIVLNDCPVLSKLDIAELIQQGRGSMKKRRNKNRVLIVSVLFVMLLAFGAGSVFAVYQQFKLKTVKLEHDAIVSETDEATEQPEETGPDTIKVALLGTDADGLRTDSMMVLVYDKKSSILNLFSVPRDTYIEVSPTLKDKMAGKIHLPSYMKLTELYSYMKRGDVESPESYTAKAIEQLMGMEIDHIVLLETSGFRKVVDAVGGVEVYVPRNLNYDDPYQNLHIHLSKGTQVLDGKEAEQFVRFRKTNDLTGYGDFGRMEMQQYFLKNFLKTLAQPENLGHMNQIITAMSDFVSTDCDFMTALGYVQYLDDVNFDRIQSHMLPGDAATINNGWYFKLKDNQELHAFVNNALEQSYQDVEDSKHLRIEVLNGSGRSGVAKKLSERLKDEGYSIADIGDYGIDRKQKTRIIVKNSGEGLDLLKYFHLAEIEVAPDKIESESDILIIVGGADA